MPDKPFYNHSPGPDYHLPCKRDPGNETHFFLFFIFFLKHTHILLHADVSKGESRSYGIITIALRSTIFRNGAWQL